MMYSNSGNYGNGTDSRALSAPQKKRGIMRNYAIRHKESGLYFHKSKEHYSVAALPWFTSKSSAVQNMANFDVPGDWELVQFEIDSGVINRKQLSDEQKQQAVLISNYSYRAYAYAESFSKYEAETVIKSLCKDIEKLMEMMKEVGAL